MHLSPQERDKLLVHVAADVARRRLERVARLTAEFDGERTVLRELASMAPLILFPRRGSKDAVVHLVNSATAPLGGGDLDLAVRVGAGATLRLSGVAATLALPGPR